MATLASVPNGTHLSSSSPRDFFAYEPFESPKKGWLLFDGRYPTGIDSKHIEVLGEALAKGLSYEAGTDIRALVGKMGGALVVAPIQAETSSLDGALLVRPGSNEFKIILSAASSSRRDQMSVAQALGHYFLHHRYFEVENQPRQRVSKSLVDREALTFALSFLMPSHEFDRALKIYGDDIEAVAASFGVPTEAVELRRELLQSR